MSETLEKLRPDRDLQCFFFHPSAIAAISGAGPDAFIVSGTWRQQFDWAVIEWNRDNVYEHPAFRYLPDGDLFGLTLTYEETRTNCIPIDSDLFPTIDWPSLRVWADDGSGEQIYKVPLKTYATGIEGSYVSASVQFQLGGTVTAGDYVGVAFLSEHYPYLMVSGDTLEIAVATIVEEVNGSSTTMTASADGTTITLTNANGASGINGNRVGVYTFVSGSLSEVWDASSRLMTGGESPTKWRIELPFATLADTVLGTIPAHAIRKMRWTYSADLQPGAYVRSEFEVGVSNWAVSGSGRSYSIAGPGSRRVEDDSPLMAYAGTWVTGSGNFSGGSIHSTSVTDSSVTCSYTAAQEHSLYVGTRLANNGTHVSVSIDGGTAFTVELHFPGEDVLVRKLLGVIAAGNHAVAMTHAGPSGSYFYFDFLELAIPTTILPTEKIESKLSLATDWDTDHSIALAPERTAWMIDILGFHGRVNHYVGALWFYELVRTGHAYASGTVEFVGSPDADLITKLYIGPAGFPMGATTVLEHLNLIGDTTESLAKAFELVINQGSTAVRAEVSGSTFTIFSRAMGLDGNDIKIATSPDTDHLTIHVSTDALAGGVDGDWRTDLAATPRLNRAVRDWTRSFFAALHERGLDATASFSMELGDGDSSLAVGIAQRYPSLAPVTLNTPALQTNFSPTSTDFWKQVYLDAANVLVASGASPYLQFGEVQWWYFPDDGSGMPYYDADTTSTFHSTYGHDLATILTNDLDPATVPDEAAFLPLQIANFTSTIMSFVRGTVSDCRFEVLYPVDVNSPALNKVVNFPVAEWTPAHLDCLKTESFTFTFERNLDLSKTSIEMGTSLGFSPSHRSHLVGISDVTTSWLKEARMAEANGFESIVLFALDQLCLIGYPLPLSTGSRRSIQMG
jgi:hypothetical protein